MAAQTAGKQGMINHIAILMDRSGSMQPHSKAVVDVVDGLVINLANSAKDRPDQETRVTVYVFDQNTDCVYYDKDVLRLPSLRGHYRIGGMTGMIKAVEIALNDLGQNPELYGDHANLVYLLTDGFESERRGPGQAEGLARKIQGLPGNYTVAALVPGDQERRAVANYGIAPDNIAEWDASSAQGLAQAGALISQATTSYMDSRASGIRTTRSLFSTGAEALNSVAVQSALQPLRSGYQLVKAIGTPEKMQIQDFVASLGHTYKVGMAYYQLIKSERIQGNKGLAVMNKKTKEVFVGTDQIRAMIGLGYGEQRVKPDMNPDFTLFVQSSSVNRHVVVNQDFILMGV